MECPKCGMELELNTHIQLEWGADNSIEITFECLDHLDGCGHKGFWVIGFDTMVETK